MSRSSKTFRQARLSVLPLEAREVPAVIVVNETMNITGTTGNDTIEILSPQPNQTIVRVNGVQQFSGAITLQKINVDGRTGSDNLLVRGLQSGVVNGVDVINVESATVGEVNPVNGLSSTSNVRSNLFVQNTNFLLLNNSAATANANIVVSATAATGIAPARIGFTFDSPFDNLTVQSGSGNDTFTMNTSQVGTTILNTRGGTDTVSLNGTTGEVRVNGGSGIDTVNVAPASRSLASIGGKVTVADGAFQDRVFISDQNTAATGVFTNYSATMTAGQLTRSATQRFGLGPISFSRTETETVAFDRVGAVNFNGTTQAIPGSQINLQGSNSLTTTTIDAGGSAVRLGSSGRVLDAIDGPVTLTGGQSNRLLFDDAGQLNGQRFTLGATTIQRIGMGTVSIGGFAGPIDISGGAGADIFTQTAPRSGGLILPPIILPPIDSKLILPPFQFGPRTVAIDGNSGQDILISPATGDNDWRVLGENRGALNSSITFADVDSLTGNAGTDTFHFANGTGVNGRIDGGGGFDTLDYKDFTTPVSVNLGTGSATRVTGGVARIQNVFGGSVGDNLTGNSGNNVLLGNGGIDVLNGGIGGRDLLVGGTGGDSLRTAGTGDTIYIGGDLAAADRNNVASVQKIMAEWTGAEAYGVRVTNLQNGTGVTGGVKLNPVVLDGDGATDAYTPKAGRDVFFVDAFDTFSAGNLPQTNELVITV